MRRLFLAVLCCALTACASAPPAPAPLAVPVLAGCPAAEQRPARPALPVASLSPGDSPPVVVKAYISTVELLKGYAAALEILLDSCK
jgi:hypothetical protein